MSPWESRVWMHMESFTCDDDTWQADPCEPGDTAQGADTGAEESYYSGDGDKYSSADAVG